MRNIIINSLLKYIKTNDKSITDEKLEIIEYGLVSIYLLISKLIIIIIIAGLIGIIKELFIFIFLYSIIRLTTFGLHASKSWICLVISTIMFIGAPIICNNIIIPNSIKLISGIIVTFFIFKNSPADTHKRPILNPKRRLFFKISSTLISVTYIVLALVINSNFISNCLIMALGCQTLFISPLIYKIFNLPYNNYKNYNLEKI